MRTDIKVSAIILAAGFSSRMGELKALLDIGGKHAILHLIDESIKAGIKDIVVVLGFKSEEILKNIDCAEVKFVVNENYEKGMYSSVQKGVQEISRDSTGFMIMPVDIPLIKSNTILEISEFFMKNQYDIVSPFFNDIKGHPPVLSVKCIESILQEEPEGGLNDIICSKDWSIYKFDTLDEGILYEMDTKEQYYALLYYYNSSYIPNEKECDEIIKRCQVPENIVLHMKKVADTSLKIGTALNNSGQEVDLKLLYSAALLHDIKRCEKAHQLRAKEFLSGLGYQRLSDIVLEHMDIYGGDSNLNSVSEKEILYLADKLVKEDKLVGLDSRFEKVIMNKDVEIAERVRIRFENAAKIVRKIKSITGKNLEEII